MFHKFNRKHQKFIIIAPIICGFLLIVFSAFFGREVFENNRRVWLVGSIIGFEEVPETAYRLPEYFIVEANNKRTIKVYYNCMITKTDLRLGERIEVLGFALGIDAITVCDNEKAYIKKL